MEALQKVFDTILEIFNIIKEFFAQLGFDFGGDAEGDAEADA